MNAPDRASWLERRRTGIGGSDVAAILGISPYRTALDVYLDKTGASQPIADSEPMYWGRRLEDVVAQEWQLRTGRKVQRVNSILRGAEPWMLANIDRAIVAEGSRARTDDTGVLRGAVGVIECKTASAYAAADWDGLDGSDALPVHYAAQGVWYLAVTGLDVCEFAALIGGQRFVQRRVERDEETIRGIVEQVREFWFAHVVAGVPPEPLTAADAAKLWAKDRGDLIDIDQNTDLLVTFNELRALRQQSKDIDAKVDALADSLKLAIGPASGLAIGGKPCATWKAAKDSQRVNWEAVANDMGSINPDALAQAVARHTTTQPGSRRFIVKD